MTGLIVLLGAFAFTAVIAIVWTVNNGRFRDTSALAPASPQQAGDREFLTAAEIGTELGQRATLLQFSTAFCSPCRATRALLSDVTSDRDDVVHVEIDAESHLDLVRRLDIRRTPTVLVLDGDGSIVGRASGLPKREQVEAALVSVTSRGRQQ